jgi:phosphatidylglycerol:prolipoprotein diacylglycerol transferase
MNFDHDSIIAPNPVFLRLGGLSIHWYAILILTGVILALLMATREGKKKGFDGELFIDLVAVGLPICILGARLYYVLFNLDWFMQHPERILAINQGGLAIHGGIIAAILYGSWYLNRKKMPILPVLDIVAVGFFIGQMIGRFGNFMNQEAYGRAINITSLDAQREFLTGLFIPEFFVNGMLINGNYHHPTFLYEALWNLAGLLIAIFVLRRLSKVLVGEIAAFYATWYSFGRIFIESLRTDSLMIGPLRVAQVISIATIVAVVGLVIRRRKNKKEMVTYLTFDLEEFNKAKKKNNKNKKKKGRA